MQSEREREKGKRERERAAKRSIKLRLLCIFSALSHNLKRADGGKIATKATYFRLNSHKFALRRCFMPQLGPRPALPWPLPFGMPHLADLISRELFRFAFVLVAACQRLVFYFYSQWNLTPHALHLHIHHITSHCIAFRLSFCISLWRPSRSSESMHKTYIECAAPKSMLSFFLIIY